MSPFGSKYIAEGGDMTCRAQVPLGINLLNPLHHAHLHLRSGDQFGLTTPTDPLGAGPIPL